MNILTDNFSLKMLPQKFVVKLNVERVDISEIPRRARSFLKNTESACLLTEKLGRMVNMNNAELRMKRRDKVFLILRKNKEDLLIYKLTIEGFIM